MKRSITTSVLFVMMLALTFTGCSDHKHNWTRVSCTEPMNCSLCAKQSFLPAGHIDSGFGFCEECKGILDFDTLDFFFDLACKGAAAKLGETIRTENYNAIKAFDDLCGTSAASHFSEYDNGYICIGALNEDTMISWITYMTDTAN